MVKLQILHHHKQLIKNFKLNTNTLCLHTSFDFNSTETESYMAEPWQTAVLKAEKGRKQLVHQQVSLSLPVISGLAQLAYSVAGL